MNLLNRLDKIEKALEDKRNSVSLDKIISEWIGLIQELITINGVLEQLESEGVSNLNFQTYRDNPELRKRIREIVEVAKL